METDNTVSIWIGNFKNLTELENYIDLTYDEEGEIVVSDFFNDFKIDINDIDEDLIEKQFYQMKQTIYLLFCELLPMRNSYCVN